MFNLFISILPSDSDCNNSIIFPTEIVEHRCIYKSTSDYRDYGLRIRFSLNLNAYNYLRVNISKSINE